MPDREDMSARALILGSAFFLFILLMLASHTSNHPNIDYQTAQIGDIEIGVLKRWQEFGGLKSKLAYQSENQEVSLLQMILAQDKNLYSDDLITGYFGPKTEGAIRKFQEEYGLPVTGDINEATRGKINQILLSYLCPQTTSIYPDLSMEKIHEIEKLPIDYVPPSLVDVSDQIKTFGIACLKEDIVPDLVAMIEGAKKEDIDLVVTSGYRKAEIQKYLVDFWLAVEGEDALSEIAEPGGSEHQLGTTIDLTDDSINFSSVSSAFATSTGGEWMQKNAYKYGFVMSYPKEDNKNTHIGYEPWHWRYVGQDIAADLRRQKITYSELARPKDAVILKEKPAKLDLTAEIFVSGVVKNNKTKILVGKNYHESLPVPEAIDLISNKIKDAGLVFTVRDFHLTESFNESIKQSLKNSYYNLAAAIVGENPEKVSFSDDNLITIFENSCGDKVISVVVGAQDVYSDMEKLLRYLNKYYDWGC